MAGGKLEAWGHLLHIKQALPPNISAGSVHVNCRIVDVWIFRLGDCNSIIVIYSQAINHGFSGWITRVNGPILAFFARKIFHTFITAVTLCKNWGFYLEKKVLCINKIILISISYGVELSIATGMNVISLDDLQKWFPTWFFTVHSIFCLSFCGQSHQKQKMRCPVCLVSI